MALLSAKEFAAWLMERAASKDGYIMCAIGQEPKKLNEWYFSGQYSGKQLEKANYWREHAQRVWDCQGLSDGYITEFAGLGIVNVRARNNYAEWCAPKGSGKIPDEYKMPGAAVFVHNGSYISHVGYLTEPVNADNPEGDWYVVEARGVMYGVVTTRLNDRGWNRWGLMTKYFVYEAYTPRAYNLGDRPLKNGCVGGDVKQLQESLIALGYSCGCYGADGEFGNATERAVKAFQAAQGMVVSGIVEEEAVIALNGLLNEDAETDACNPEPEAPTEPEPGKAYTVTGGTVWIWDGHPAHGGEHSVIVRKGDKLPALDAGEYVPIVHNGVARWINKKYVAEG